MTDHFEKSQFNVYLGVWTNWSRGRILGATLTLDRTYGLLLLSFTATFVGFVASRFWRIITLVLHRIYSTPEPRDALHHQRQVALRNSSSAVSTLWTSLQLAWCWRTIANGYLARTLPILILAASAICAFTVAGGFTSSISSGIGNDVLIDGSQCGNLSPESSESGDLTLVYPWMSQSMNNAANYAQQCYSFNTTGALGCTTFIKSYLAFNSVLNASCPFSNSICRSNDSNIFLDSGLISSDSLGLNMPGSQRMFYREVLHCAPLRTDGFVSNASTVYNNYTRYSYGESGRDTWTYEVENLDLRYQRQADNPKSSNTVGFDLQTMISRTANGTVWVGGSDFVPIPQLTVSDADLLLIFLSAEGILFLEKTEDPWYHATDPRVLGKFNGREQTLYWSDEAASPMGCVQRVQYCNSSKKCGSLAGIEDAVDSALPLFYGAPGEKLYAANLDTSHEPNATISRFIYFQDGLTTGSMLYEMLSTLGSSALLSPQHLMGGSVGPLPNNQWQLDIAHWFAIRMASMQAAFVNTARGLNDGALFRYFWMANDKHQQGMCKNQKILSTDYISLSLFGLYFTYLTGIVVILASYITEPLLALFYSHRKYEEYKYLEWTGNSTLQLQRLAYQGLGSEKWSNYTDDIPKTRPGYFLADLARAYPPEDDNDGVVHEVKPTVHATSTTTPSVSETSANLRVSQQSRGSPSRPVSTVSELAPQAASPQAVSPISQHPQG